MGTEEEPKKRKQPAPRPRPAPRPKPAKRAPAPRPKPAPKRAPAPKPVPAPKPAPPPKVEKAPRRKAPVPAPRPAPKKVKSAPKRSRKSPPRVPPPPPKSRADPLTVPEGIALGAAPLVAAPVVALAAGRSFLQGTQERRAKIQEDIDRKARIAAEKEKNKIAASKDSGTLTKAGVSNSFVFIIMAGRCSRVSFVTQDAPASTIGLFLI